MRRGFTLVELVVSLAISGVAFGAFAGVVVHQERVHARLAHRMHARAQALAGLAALDVELRGLSPTSGDIAVAQDSAIEFRAAVASISVCERRDSVTVTALASGLAALKSGDTLWALGSDDSVRWLPAPLSEVANIASGDTLACVGAPPVLGSPAHRAWSRHRYRLTFAHPPPASLQPRTPARLTRRVRYSLYRAPDGQWYLGRREWSTALGRFETIQPVSGPYRADAPPGSGLSGLELRYLDRDGREIDPAGSSRRIARIELTIRTRPPPSDGTLQRRRDVTSVTVAPRNAT